MQTQIVINVDPRTYIKQECRSLNNHRLWITGQVVNTEMWH